MINLQIAVDHVLGVAEDNSRGYSQPRRQEEKEDDCSTLALDALRMAGVAIGSATYTGNALQPLLASGFVDVSASVNLATGEGLKKYDVLLRPATTKNGGHMAIMVTDTELVQAAGDLDGKRGDSSGREIYKRNYVGSFSTVPKHVLRYPETVSDDPEISEGDLVKIVIPCNTSADGSGKDFLFEAQLGKVIKIVTNVTFPYGVCYNGDSYIDCFFKKINIKKVR